MNHRKWEQWRDCLGSELKREREAGECGDATEVWIESDDNGVIMIKKKESGT